MPTSIRPSSDSTNSSLPNSVRRRIGRPSAAPRCGTRELDLIDARHQPIITSAEPGMTQQRNASLLSGGSIGTRRPTSAPVSRPDSRRNCAGMPGARRDASWRGIYSVRLPDGTWRSSSRPPLREIIAVDAPTHLGSCPIASAPQRVRASPRCSIKAARTAPLAQEFGRAQAIDEAASVVPVRNTRLGSWYSRQRLPSARRRRTLRMARAISTTRRQRGQRRAARCR